MLALFPSCYIRSPNINKYNKTSTIYHHISSTYNTPSTEHNNAWQNCSRLPATSDPNLGPPGLGLGQLSELTVQGLRKDVHWTGRQDTSGSRIVKFREVPCRTEVILQKWHTVTKRVRDKLEASWSSFNPTPSYFQYSQHLPASAVSFSGCLTSQIRNASHLWIPVKSKSCAQSLRLCPSKIYWPTRLWN
jgi:hypothetical protein